MKTLQRMKEDWLLATEIHKLEARLWRQSRVDDLRVVVVTSSTRGDGKSTTVAYLATALAQYPDRKVLAVDLDLREPSLGKTIGITPWRSIADVLQGECSADDAITSTELENLDLALPLQEGEDPSLLLRTPELYEAFKIYREKYDLVIMDVPALLPVADASLLIPLADGVILTAMAGKTTKPQLIKARELCLGMGATIIGIVVGNLQEAEPGYGSYGHYGGHSRNRSSAAPDVTDSGTAG